MYSAKFAVMQRLQNELEATKQHVQRLIWTELRDSRYTGIPKMDASATSEGKDFPYKIEERIGQGTFGIVSKGRSREGDNSLVAIKRLNKHKVGTEEF